MENQSTSPQKSFKKEAGPLGKVVNFLASMQLATFLLLGLFVITWFATLEQTVNGLKPMMDKYFNWKELFFFPEIGKPWQEDGALVPIKIYFPMLSGFWLCVLFTINLTLGGLIRFRKSPQKIGILLSHFSIVFLMVAAGVTQLTEKRGALQIYEGKVSDAAQDYHEEVIEVSELADGKVTKVHLVDWEYLKDLRKGGERLFRMTDLPFNLKVTKLYENAQVSPAQFVPPMAGETVRDGFYLKKLARQKETEAHMSGAEVSVLTKEGESLKELLLASRSLKSATVTVDGRPYLLRLRKKLWPLPFGVQLDDFRVERDPGTNRAAAYESDVTRLEGDDTEEVLIQMNEPMRREGWTFFQANWGPQDQVDPAEYYSVFEVVRNPADHWPLYSLLISMAGLIGHFLYKLISFLKKPRKAITS
ncbi:MAG: cytochrome c biogenesis protein ResB [Roseibacillus sp.]